MESRFRSEAARAIRRAATRFATSKRAILAGVAVLLALFALQAVGSMRKKCVTTDEIMYIAPGPEWGFASDVCLELRRCIRSDVYRSLGPYLPSSTSGPRTRISLWNL